MNALRMPSIHLTEHSELGEDSVQSLLISLLRGLAALQVAAAHLRSEMFPGLRTLADPPLAYQGLAFITGFAHQAVIVFFLISGWLVGGSLLGKLGQPQAFASYAIDRMTRLWTVLVPTFVLMLMIGLFAGELVPGAVDYSSANNFSATSFLGNLVGLQTVTMDNFGGNYVLWSLANETWYYLMFPLLLVCMGRFSTPMRIAAGLALLTIGLALPYVIVLYFLIWLLGAVFSRVRVECGNFARGALLLAFLAIAVYYRMTGINDDAVPEAFAQDLVFSMAFLLLLAGMRMRVNPASGTLLAARKVGTVFADFSFTLYVLHLPLIGLMHHVGSVLFDSTQLSPTNPLHYAVYAGMLAALLALCYLSYLMFESHTGAVRRFIKGIALRGGAQPLRQM